MFKAKDSKKPATQHGSEVFEQAQELAVLRGIQSAMPDPYYVRDMEYNVILWPEAIQKITGYSEAEAKQMKCYDIFKAVVCKDCPTQKCVHAKSFLRDAQVSIWNKKGEELTTLVSNAGVYDEAGNPVGAVEVVKDFSSLHRLMQALQNDSEQLSAVSEELAASSEEVFALSNNLNEQANVALEETGNGIALARNVEKKSEDCNAFALKVKDNMGEVSQSMKSSVELISTLKDKSETIVSIIATIQQISSHTKLLALNASIEAVRAGEAGKGFAVVASEIRKLAESSNQSAIEIKATIDEISKFIKKTVDNISITEKNIQAGESNIVELLKYINAIDQATLNLVHGMSEIEKVSKESLEISNNQNVSMEEVAKVSQDLAEIAQKIQDEIRLLEHSKM